MATFPLVAMALATGSLVVCDAILLGFLAAVSSSPEYTAGGGANATDLTPIIISVASRSAAARNALAVATFLHGVAHTSAMTAVAAWLLSPDNRMR